MRQPVEPSIILEFARIDNAMEVRAIDASDGLEISFMAPANTPEAEIELIARRKLAWVRARKEGSGGHKNKPPHSSRGGRGIVV